MLQAATIIHRVWVSKEARKASWYLTTGMQKPPSKGMQAGRCWSPMMMANGYHGVKSVSLCLHYR
jgi:hypothetical protein